MNSTPKKLSDFSLSLEEIEFLKKIKLRYPDYDYSIDPENYECLPSQKYCLQSFVTSPGATPDENGFFGMSIIFGSFADKDEATKYAKKILLETNSLLKINIVKNGHFFPICDIDLPNNQTDLVTPNDDNVRTIIGKTIKSHEKSERAKETKLNEQMELKKDDLIKDTKNENDPLKNYTTDKVKLCGYVSTFCSMTENRDKLKEKIIELSTKVDTIEKENPSFENDFINPLMESQKSLGYSEKEANERIVKITNYKSLVDFL